MHAERVRGVNICISDRLRKFVMFCLAEWMIFTIFSLMMAFVTNKLI